MQQREIEGATTWGMRMMCLFLGGVILVIASAKFESIHWQSLLLIIFRGAKEIVSP